MGQAEKEPTHTTDEDIEEILRQNEAGIADLLDAYEPIEQQYFSVATVNRPAVTSATNTAGPS